MTCQAAPATCGGPRPCSGRGSRGARRGGGRRARGASGAQPRLPPVSVQHWRPAHGLGVHAGRWAGGQGFEGMGLLCDGCLWQLRELLCPSLGSSARPWAAAAERVGGGGSAGRAGCGQACGCYQACMPWAKELGLSSRCSCSPASLNPCAASLVVSSRRQARPESPAFFVRALMSQRALRSVHACVCVRLCLSARRPLGTSCSWRLSRLRPWRRPWIQVPSLRRTRRLRALPAALPARAGPLQWLMPV